MKKTLSFIIILTLVCILLLSCGNNSKERIDYLINLCRDSYFTTYKPSTNTINEIKDEYKNDLKSDKFIQALKIELKRICDNKKWMDLFSFLQNLRVISYSDQTIKEVVWDEIRIILDSKNSDTLDMVSSYSSYCYINEDFNKCQLFPRQELIYFFENNGIKPNLSETGYYSKNKNKYKNSSEFISPIGMDKTGTYTESVSYSYHGDILIKYYSKKWYGTSEYDENNSKHFYIIWRNSKSEDIIIYGDSNKYDEAKYFENYVDHAHIYIIEIENPGLSRLENITLIELNNNYVFTHGSSIAVIE